MSSNPQRKVVVRIVKAVCDDMGVPVCSVFGPRRHDKVAWARMTAIYLVQCRTSMSPHQIASIFHRCEGVIHYAARKAQERYCVDKEYAAHVSKLLKTCLVP